jgi:glucosamine-phosphate N-acetyltransferase
MQAEFIYISLWSLVQKNPNSIHKLKDCYLELLSNLTEAPQISNTLFLENLEKVEQTGEIIICCTHENIELDNFFILGSGTGFIEPKIIRGGKNVCHVEDIVVHEKYRGYGIAKQIIQMLINYSKEMGCYKAILDTQDKTVGFYEKCGFTIKGTQMAIYL